MFGTTVRLVVCVQLAYISFSGLQPVKAAASNGGGFTSQGGFTDRRGGYEGFGVGDQDSGRGNYHGGVQQPSLTESVMFAQQGPRRDDMSGGYHGGYQSSGHYARQGMFDDGHKSPAVPPDFSPVHLSDSEISSFGAQFGFQNPHHVSTGGVNPMNSHRQMESVQSRGGGRQEYGFDGNNGRGMGETTPNVPFSGVRGQHNTGFQGSDSWNGRDQRDQGRMPQEWTGRAPTSVNEQKFTGGSRMFDEFPSHTSHDDTRPQSPSIQTSQDVMRLNEDQFGTNPRSESGHGGRHSLLLGNQGLTSSREDRSLSRDSFSNNAPPPFRSQTTGSDNGQGDVPPLFGSTGQYDGGNNGPVGNMFKSTSVYDKPVDDNPNNWVKHQNPLETLPPKVVIPLKLVAGDVYGTVVVGTPFHGSHEQHLSVLFDTGSSDMWILPKELVGNPAVGKKMKPFDKSKSSTFRTSEPVQQLNDIYVSAKVEGVVVYDTVKFGQGDSTIQLRNQGMGQASSFQGLFANHEAIVGLDFVAPPIITGKPDPVLYTMVKQFGSAPKFGFYLNLYKSEDSKLFIGGGEMDYVDSQFTSHDVVKVPFENKGSFFNGWNIHIDKLVVERDDVTLSAVTLPQGTVAHPDSGCTAIVGPTGYIKQLNDEIFKGTSLGVNSDYMFPCDAEKMMESFGVLPDVSIVMSGNTYALWPSDYITSTSGGMCQSMFKPDEKVNFFLIGRTFMTRYFTRYDFSNKIIEFAKAKRGEHNNYQLFEDLRNKAKEKRKTNNNNNNMH